MSQLICSAALLNPERNPDDCAFFKKEEIMLYTIAVILLVMWLLGMVSAYTIGGFIHILLVIAIVMILVRVIRGERL